jgi:hypothetical protein
VLLPKIQFKSVRSKLVFWFIVVGLVSSAGIGADAIKKQEASLKEEAVLRQRIRVFRKLKELKLRL